MMTTVLTNPAHALELCPLVHVCVLKCVESSGRVTDGMTQRQQGSYRPGLANIFDIQKQLGSIPKLTLWGTPSPTCNTSLISHD